MDALAATGAGLRGPPGLIEIGDDLGLNASSHDIPGMGRGIQAQVITDLNEPWGSSQSCTSCGKCVHVCPTGALFEKGKSVAEMLKRRQFLPYLTLMRGEEQE